MANRVEVLAFLVCDSTMKDASTGKATLSGIFDRLWARQFPCLHPRCSIYFRLRFLDQNTKATELTLVITSPSGMKQAMPSVTLPVQEGGIAEGSINIEGLPFPAEGAYEIELRIDNERLTGYPLTVMKLEERPNGQQLH